MNSHAQSRASLSELVLTDLTNAPMLLPLAKILALPHCKLCFRAIACGCHMLQSLQTLYWVMPALEDIVVEGSGRAKAFEEP